MTIAAERRQDGPGSAGRRQDGAAGRAGADRTAVTVLAVAAVLLLATRQAFTVPYTGLGQSPAQLLITVLVLLWVITRVAGQRATSWVGLLSALVVLRVAVDLVSYGLAMTRSPAAAAVSSADSAVQFDVTSALLVFLVVTVVRTVADVRRILRAVVIGAAVSGAFAVVQYATGTDIAAAVRLPGLRVTDSALVTALLREGLARAQGAAAHPLELGAVMTVSIPVGIALTLQARAEGARSWPWAVATAVCLAGGLVSLSRSVVVGLLAALAVMVWRWPARRVAWGVAVAAVVALVATLSGAKLASALIRLFLHGSGDYSLQSRSNGRHYVFLHYADHLWLGQGLGTYVVPVQPVLDNQYLDQLMETGLIGLTLFAAVVFVAVGYALHASAVLPDRAGAELASGLAGSLAAFAVIDLILDSSGFVQISLLGWLLIALAAATRTLLPATVGPSPVTAGAAAVR